MRQALLCLLVICLDSCTKDAAQQIKTGRQVSEDVILFTSVTDEVDKMDPSILLTTGVHFGRIQRAKNIDTILMWNGDARAHYYWLCICPREVEGVVSSDDCDAEQEERSSCYIEYSLLSKITMPPLRAGQYVVKVKSCIEEQQVDFTVAAKEAPYCGAEEVLRHTARGATAEKVAMFEQKDQLIRRLGDLGVEYHQAATVFSQELQACVKANAKVAKYVSESVYKMLGMIAFSKEQVRSSAELSGEQIFQDAARRREAEDKTSFSAASGDLLAKLWRTMSAGMAASCYALSPDPVCRAFGSAGEFIGTMAVAMNPLHMVGTLGNSIRVVMQGAHDTVPFTCRAEETFNRIHDGVNDGMLQIHRQLEELKVKMVERGYLPPE